VVWYFESEMLKQYDEAFVLPLHVVFYCDDVVVQWKWLIVAMHYWHSTWGFLLYTPAVVVLQQLSEIRHGRHCIDHMLDWSVGPAKLVE
jgi:hypothetical protein